MSAYPERYYCFHDLIRIRVRAERPVYLRYFDREYQGLANNSSSSKKTVDIFLQIGGSEKRTVPNSEIRTARTFNDALTLTYAVSGLSDQATTIWVQDHLAARLVPNFIAPLIQTSILEPIIYLRCLKKGVLILHAATLARGDRGLIVAAEGGTGKTSTALNLLHCEPSWHFLGDDLVFVNSQAVAYNYPRPLHLFRAHLEMLPFLRVSTRRRAEIVIKDYMRLLFQNLYGHKFYLATRVAVQDALPAAQTQTHTKLSALVLLQAKGKSQHVDITDPMSLDWFVTTLLETSDLRPLVYQWLGSSETAACQAEETRLIREIIANIRQIWTLNRGDVTEERIAGLMEDSKLHKAS